MEKIVFPLEPGQKGSAVAALHAALKLLLDQGKVLKGDPATRQALSQALPREASTQTFGTITSRVVILIQRELGLEATGKVDERTANALNALLRELGVLPDEPARPADLTRVIDIPIRPGIPLDPRILDPRRPIDPKIPVDPKTPVDPKDPGGSKEPKEPEDSGRPKDPKDPKEPADPGRPPRDGEWYVVQGRVINHEGRGLPGVLVKAVDKNVGEDVVVGEAETGERGAYEIRFPATMIKAGKDKPDIQVQAHDRNGRILGKSDVRYNAAMLEAGLDVVVPANALPKAAEYDRVLADLGRHLGARDGQALEKQLAALREDDEREDITYLANKTGWDARMVAMTALASQFASRTGIEPDYYYALFRTGIPANEAFLERLSPDMVRQIWERAVKQGVLSEERAKGIPGALERFKAHAARHMLEAPAQVGVSSLRDRLAGVLDNPRDQQRFAQLYYDLRGDLNAFWQAVRKEFPRAAERLELDGKLAFLTINNGPLMQHLHQRVDGLRTPVDLVRQGFYKAERWEKLLGDNVPIPAEVPGETVSERRANYAALMASQLRLSYPTAVVAAMVSEGVIPLRADARVKQGVARFLEEHQGRFELGVQPIERYLRRNQMELEAPVLAQVKALQRVYQITPTDEAMGPLLSRGIDSAYAVVRYDEKTFVREFADHLGGERMARLTYAKAHQVHHTVLNLVTSYFLEKSAPVPYSMAHFAMKSDPDASGVLAYPTLEALFGEMDYCSCEHCRSWLSPAAYLVDLLLLLDPPTYEKEKPLQVLLSRRPDIQHLQLTCENTNTALPYIDLVNEILEHFVVNGSLSSFTGHNIEGDVTSEELMASPQFVNDAAYRVLREKAFPAPLPFHQPLEALRRIFNHFRVPLHEAMERLRRTDRLDREGDGSGPSYGWRDILMERLQISRQEWELFTGSALSLPALYGEDRLSEAELVDYLSNAKRYARKMGLTYEELVEITRTRFINPHRHLLPKLERLGVGFGPIWAMLQGAMSEAAFNALLPADLPLAAYGGNVVRWLRDQEREVMGLIVLSDPDPDAAEKVCSFDTVELRYSLPDFARNKLKPIEFLKLLRFIRLWRKLGWSIEQTDKALCALYPAGLWPAPGDDEAAARAKLDAGFEKALIGLAHLHVVMDKMGLTPGRDLAALLACWAPIDTDGPRSLYRQMFLSPAVRGLTGVFEEDGYGNFLHDETQRLIAHREALRAAFNLTAEEFDLIAAELGFDAATVLNLDNVSAVYRHGYLARALKLSVREFLALKKLSGLDPFLPLDLSEPGEAGGGASPGSSSFGSVRPPAVRFIELVQLIRESPLRVNQLLYFLQHVDFTGTASPSHSDVLTFAQRLRADLLRIEREHAVEEDPTGEIARAKMALVYPPDAADTFFGLLNGTSVFEVEYSHPEPDLPSDVKAVTDRLNYDDFRKRLAFRGVMTEDERTRLKAVPGATGGFLDAVDALYEEGRRAFAGFFDRYPELLGLYEGFVGSTAPREERMSALLAGFLPELRDRLKRQQVRQTVVSQVGADPETAEALLEAPALLHAEGASDQPSRVDFLALEQQGLSADIYFGDAVSGSPDVSGLLVSTVDYRPGRASLPAAPGGKASGVWRGFVEAPDNGYYNFYVEADAGARVELKIGGRVVPMAVAGGVWRNDEAVELEAGRLVELQLTAEGVAERLVLRWEAKGMGRAPIPPERLYPADALERFAATYLRMLKALTLAEVLQLSARELEHFALHPDYAVRGASWLNALPVRESPGDGTGRRLLNNVAALIRYRAAKEAHGVRDERLLALLRDPAATAPDGAPLFQRVAGWRPEDRSALVAHFGLRADDLKHLDVFLRLDGAIAVAKSFGVGAATLLAATTNEPAAGMVRDLQGSLRARYERGDWFKVIKPLNDELRIRQRDALVAYVLHRLAQNPATAHIDTPDKLFEYFLVDVQMEPCMATSRIRLAISSVQLFIQRCLLNLEPRVASTSIPAERWEWMKHYRLWEANRKVFLWPENWLEPELRDNKSPFFKELESELLQTDITDETAAAAYVRYLEKLDEVAKLEICGMYYEENEEGYAADDVVHVIGRTAGARRAYYYRRQDGSLAWSPWEKVDVEIEDNPVLPVVWRGRLFLFWVGVTQEPETAPDGSDQPMNLTNVRPSALRKAAGDAQVRVKLTLYWSEHVNGRWQPPRTSDVNKPLELGRFPATGDGAFDRAELTLRSHAEADVLVIKIGYPGRDVSQCYFKLYNTHSLPVRGADDVDGYWPPLLEARRTFSSREAPFVISYAEGPKVVSFQRRVLNRGSLYEVIAPRHPVQRVFEAPFFFQDRRHVFYVTSRQGQVWVGGYLDVGLWVPEVSVVVDPPVLVQPEFPIPPVDPVVLVPEVTMPWVADPTPVEHFLNQSANVYQGLATPGTVRYGDRLIGPGGSVAQDLGIVSQIPVRG